MCFSPCWVFSIIVILFLAGGDLKRCKFWSFCVSHLLQINDKINRNEQSKGESSSVPLKKTPSYLPPFINLSASLYSPVLKHLICSFDLLSMCLGSVTGVSWDISKCWIYSFLCYITEKAMATHSSTLAWKIPWTEEPGGLQSVGSRRVGHDWATSLSLFPFVHWRRKWQPTPVFLPGESQGQRSLVGCRLLGHTESDTTKVT